MPRDLPASASYVLGFCNPSLRPTEFNSFHSKGSPQRVGLQLVHLFLWHLRTSNSYSNLTDPFLVYQSFTHSTIHHATQTHMDNVLLVYKYRHQPPPQGLPRVWNEKGGVELTSQMPPFHQELARIETDAHKTQGPHPPLTPAS